MNQITTALSPEQIAKIEAHQAAKVEREANRTSAAHKPQVEFVNPPKPREITYRLMFPLKVDGKLYEEVTLRRPSMREWRAYLTACEEAVKAGGPGADDLVDLPWMSITAAVIEELDTHDGLALEATQMGFFGSASLPQEESTDPTLSS